MKKIFISYTGNDVDWAEWIAWQLEEKGYQVILQSWDFRPGSNFSLKMQEAATDADFTIAVLSEDYMKSVFTQPEWAAAFIKDPTGKERKLIPVRVRPCKPNGLLASIVYIELVGLNEKNAATTLMDGINSERAKPEKAPLFPGNNSSQFTATHESANKPIFPPNRICLYKLPTTGNKLFGRDEELKFLDEAWEDEHCHIVTLVAWGGVGKTSLVNEWLNRMENANFKGARKVYGWSFYSQGADEGKQVSADDFIIELLEWFGDIEPEKGSAIDKGRRLAELVKKEKTLLILDGMEPLQYPPNQGHGLDGRIKDQGLKVMLKELAISGQGLCIITSREPLADLKHNTGIDKPVRELKLEHLSTDAGTQLLRHLGVNGAKKEMEKAVTEFGGHALALTLLGRYLQVVLEGDIRQRDKIPVLMEERKQGVHARRIMQAYETWLENKERPCAELSILRIMGLFDRPAEKGAIEALKKEPAIKGVTDCLQDIDDKNWKYALNHLRELGLLSKENPAKQGALDCHPLMREHFAQRLEKENKEGWQAANLRLYEYYKELPEKELPDTLEEMEPLFAAVAHGCRAGRHQEVMNKIYSKKIKRYDEAYSVKMLGAIGADLAALSHFFVTPWKQPVEELTDNFKAAVLSWSAFDLHSLGRLIEAIEPMKAGLKWREETKDWEGTAMDTNNLCELMLTLGKIEEAVYYGAKAVVYADKGNDEFLKEGMRTTYADALHQAGQLKEAEALFHKAEETQKKRQKALGSK